MSAVAEVVTLKQRLAEAERRQEQEARSAAKAEADKLNGQCRSVKDSLLKLQGEIYAVKDAAALVGARTGALEQQIAQLGVDLQSEYATGRELELAARARERLEGQLRSARQGRDQLQCRLGLLQLDASRSMVRLQQLDFMLSDARARAAGVKVGAPEQGGVYSVG
jgi:chromosome segregation ATPase